MTSPAHHEAAKAAMEKAGCRRGRVPSAARPEPFCHRHSGWDDARDVCSVIDSAARIAYDLGRRDALNESADIASQERTTRTGAYHVGGNEALTFVAERIRALASTPANEGA